MFCYCKELHQLQAVKSLLATAARTRVTCNLKALFLFFLEGFSLWEKKKLPINSILLNVACSNLLKDKLRRKDCTIKYL